MGRWWIVWHRRPSLCCCFGAMIVGTGVSPVQRWCYDGVSATVILSEGDSPSRRIPLAAKMRTWLNVILSELAWASESKNPFVASTAHENDNLARRDAACRVSDPQ